MAGKLLILESDWRPAPLLQPTQPRSATRLYSAAVRSACLPRSAVLTADTWPHRVREFTRLRENRSGPNVVIFSTHGAPAGENGPLLAAPDGAFAPFRQLSELRAQLRRSLLIFDTCHLGRNATELREAGDALGVVGFSGVVEWTASTAFILALLRAFNTAGIWSMRRASAGRPRKLLETMQHGEYLRLMAALGVRFCFRA